MSSAKDLMTSPIPNRCRNIVFLKPKVHAPRIAVSDASMEQDRKEIDHDNNFEKKPTTIKRYWPPTYPIIIKDIRRRVISKQVSLSGMDRQRIVGMQHIVSQPDCSQLSIKSAPPRASSCTKINGTAYIESDLEDHEVKSLRAEGKQVHSTSSPPGESTSHVADNCNVEAVEKVQKSTDAMSSEYMEQKCKFFMGDGNDALSKPCLDSALPFFSDKSDRMNSTTFSTSQLTEDSISLNTTQGSLESGLDILVPSVSSQQDCLDSGTCSEFSDYSERAAVSKNQPIGRSHTQPNFWTNQFHQSINRANRKSYKLVAKTLFNTHPVEGVQYLVAHDVISPVPVAIARFLLTEDGLSREAIGEYFGTITDTRAVDVFNEFLQLIDMKGLEVDEALRSMLSLFHPVGESQKISHIVEVFRDVYAAQNQESVSLSFASVETIEVLAYSILMLHTDLHNPNVRRAGKRMSEEEFIKNNRGIDAGRDLSSTMIRNIYQRVSGVKFTTLPDPIDQLRHLDRILIGSLKMDPFIQRHRRFIGYLSASLVKKFVSYARSRHHLHVRTLFIFNDVLLIAKEITRFRRVAHSMVKKHAVAMEDVQRTGVSSTPEKGDLTKMRSASSTSLRSLSRGRNEKLMLHSTQPPIRGTFQIRMVLPMLDLGVLVFESSDHPFGVQLCQNGSPFLNLSMINVEQKRNLIDWLNMSIVEMQQLHQYSEEKKLNKQHANGTQSNTEAF